MAKTLTNQEIIHAFESNIMKCYSEATKFLLKAEKLVRLTEELGYEPNEMYKSMIHMKHITKLIFYDSVLDNKPSSTIKEGITTNELLSLLNNEESKNELKLVLENPNY
jgi:hypothetical protein